MTSRDALHERLLGWLASPTPEFVFQRFANEFPGHDWRGTGDEAFIYIPGPRANRVLLVAHADTVFDGNEDWPPVMVIKDGVVHSTHDKLGIGADDRAGVALLWELRDLGHSLLITSGEEKGLLGAKWLLFKNAELTAEINESHQFVVQFDRQNGTDFKCYRVGTEAFRRYVADSTGYVEPDRRRCSDICAVCRTVCGVNMSVGYRDEHSPNETLHLAEWERTLEIARKWLSASDLPRFAGPFENPTE